MSSITSTTGSKIDASTHTPTRIAMHSVAEHLLSADLHHHTAKIGLRQTSEGFGQPEFIVDGERRRLRVEGTSLVVLRGDAETWTPLTTLAAAAEAADAELGAPTQVFTPETVLEPTAVLNIDTAAASRLADWYALVEAALDTFRRANAQRQPAIAQLWPEHFDLAISLGEVNFGGSPGDGGIAEPYLYVGPWTPLQGEFWNQPFGASLTFSEIHGPEDAAAFFGAGLEAALAA